ncbi:hypothetical protein PUN28_003524 [Cardiocondyla obscurior]|uniref:Uncharacterized protein n=1 Tax=Cardiocondyla obscurior TaxID=286306 RepID=A0AAW2GNM5_9HYME
MCLIVARRDVSCSLKSAQQRRTRYRTYIRQFSQRFIFSSELNNIVFSMMRKREREIDRESTEKARCEGAGIKCQGERRGTHAFKTTTKTTRGRKRDSRLVDGCERANVRTKCRR